MAAIVPAINRITENSAASGKPLGQMHASAFDPVIEIPGPRMDHAHPFRAHIGNVIGVNEMSVVRETGSRHRLFVEYQYMHPAGVDGATADLALQPLHKLVEHGCTRQTGTDDCETETHRYLLPGLLRNPPAPFKSAAGYLIRLVPGDRPVSNKPAWRYTDLP